MIYYIFYNANDSNYSYTVIPSIYGDCVIPIMSHTLSPYHISYKQKSILNPNKSLTHYSTTNASFSVNPYISTSIFYYVLFIKTYS